LREIDVFKKASINGREVFSMEGFRVEANAQEAMLVDWVLTLHNYSPDYLEYLMKPDIQQMRYQAGRIIIDNAGEFELLEGEIKWLLSILPITFRFGKEDVGYSLKKKLYEAYLGKRPEYPQEEVSHASSS
jgi:hypothetical protein